MPLKDTPVVYMESILSFFHSMRIQGQSAKAAKHPLTFFGSQFYTINRSLNGRPKCVDITQSMPDGHGLLHLGPKKDNRKKLIIWFLSLEFFRIIYKFRGGCWCDCASLEGGQKN